MDYTIISSEEDLINNFNPIGKGAGSMFVGFAKCKFDIDIQIPFNERLMRLFESKWDILSVSDNKKSIQFNSCVFLKTLSSTTDNEEPGLKTANFEFVDCVFEDEFNLSDSTFGGKFKFRRCEFEEVNFFNTTFGDLADFYSCKFNKKTIFLKTDFIGTAVFSASEFKKNVLFTFTLIDKLIIFRGTKFKRGLDLSLSIGQGSINCFRISLKDYKAKHIDVPEDEYEGIYDDYVTDAGIIPIENKRETFRILKQTLVNQDNISESIYFKGLEKETLRKELKKKSATGRKYFSRKEADRYLERFNLWLSKWSNDHGNSYGRAFVFLILSSWIFFYFSLINTSKYCFSLCVSEWEFSSGAKYFIQFLFPAHGLDYIEKDVSSWWFYFWDYLGRIVVGYGIYQFIKAFRKYR